MSFAKKSWQSGFIVPIPLLVLLLILAALPLTVIVSQKQQEIRQRAVNHCTEVTTACPSNVILGDSCTNQGTQCRLGNDIVECR